MASQGSSGGTGSGNTEEQGTKKRDLSVAAGKHQAEQDASKGKKSDSEVYGVIKNKIESYGSLEDFLKNSRKMMEEAAPLSQKYWTDLGLCGNQPQKIIEAVKEIQSQVKESGVNPHIVWVNFGALWRDNARMEGPVGRDLQQSNREIVEQAIKEAKNFEIPEEFKSSKTILETFAINRIQYDFKDAIKATFENERQKIEATKKESPEEEGSKSLWEGFTTEPPLHQNR
jgi:uncharacterized protein YqgV (UPF0045/DUF77 family)